VTVKTRLGFTEDKLVAKTLLPALESCGARALALHGRTRAQRYARNADWDYIIDAARGCTVPVLGNGDAMWYTDYEAYVGTGGGGCTDGCGGWGGTFRGTRPLTHFDLDCSVCFFLSPTCIQSTR
jgi:tRNA-dihydrouridine synthase B